MNDSIKLNLGCGLNKRDGFINIDRNERVNPDLLQDITEGLPFSDDSVAEIHAFDFLEHIPPASVIFVMNEIYRVLQPGGKFISHTPDAEHGQGAFCDPTHISFWTEDSWLYYSVPAYRELYGIDANFSVDRLQRVLTDPRRRIYHLYVEAIALKGGVDV